MPKAHSANGNSKSKKMNDEVDLILEETTERMQKAIEHLEYELSKLRAGRANPAILDGITIEYYGVTTPLSQVSNINTPDAKTITIQPWDRNMIGPIEKAIMAANIGITPINNGEIIRMNIPPLTQERRLQLVKQVKSDAESAKIAIRSARKWANDELKAAEKDGLPEDMQKSATEKVQTMTTDYSSQVDKIATAKEKEVMTV